MFVAIFYILVYLPSSMEEKIIHKVFKTITILKGLQAIITILLGIALLMLSKEFVSNIIIFLVKIGLAGNPDNFIAQNLLQFGINLTLEIKLYFSIYFMIHGAVGLSLVWGIIKKPSITYPVSLLIFIGFVIYQIYSYFIAPSMWLLLLTLFDVLFIGLLFYEYNNHLKDHSFLGKLKLIARAEIPNIVEIKIPKIRFIKLTNMNKKRSFSFSISSS